MSTARYEIRCNHDRSKWSLFEVGTQTPKSLAFARKACPVLIEEFEAETPDEARQRYEAAQQREADPSVDCDRIAGWTLPADHVLIHRLVQSPPTGRGRLPRWSHVAWAFSVGSTTGAALCRRFGVDPDEMLGEWQEPKEDRF